MAIKGIKFKNSGQFVKGSPGFNRNHTEESKKKMSLSHKGKTSNWKGRHPSKESRLKMSESQRKRFLRDGGVWKGKKFPQVAGDKSHFWKGGITPINTAIRESLEYRLWRESVFARDNYTCIWCGAKNGNGKTIILHADHIKPFAEYPELRFAIDNGRTLCIDCHRKTDTFGRH